MSVSILPIRISKGLPSALFLGISLVCGLVLAQPPPPPAGAASKPADLAETVADLIKSGDKGTITVAPAASPHPVEITGGDSGGIRGEVQAMRDTLEQLQETLDFLVNRVMADLEAENAQLRQEVRLVHGRLGEQGLEEPVPVPRPGRDLIEQVLKERTQTAAQQERDATPVDGAEESPKETPAEPVPFSCTTLDEWGRAPEVAAELGPNTTSVKGMVCVVPPGSSKEDLIRLGREFHEKYQAYDNLNIEVFDNEAAARDYSDRHIVNQEHRVLSISKHKESNRDVILLLENGVAAEIMP